MKSKELYLVQLCLHIQYYIMYISGWKMCFNNKKLMGVALASVTLALDVYSKQQKKSCSPSTMQQSETSHSSKYL